MKKPIITEFGKISAPLTGSKASADFIRMLEGYGLATAEILYGFPDHKKILQSYVWQEYDVAPEFPVLRGFLNFWRENLDGPVRFVHVEHSALIRPAEIKLLGGEFRIN